MTPRERMRDGDATVGVVGLGYVGLPLAVSFADRGHRVIGVDVDEDVAERIRAADPPIQDLPADQLKRLVGPEAGAGDRGVLEPTTEMGRLADCDVVFLCVPTPVDENDAVDLTPVEEATRDVAEALEPGNLVVLQSTTYPGTTEEVVRPILEESGLEAGAGFHLAFSPERVDPGNETWTIENTPKVVGGLTETCTDLAGAVLGGVYDDVHEVSSPRAAEMTKLLENTFRSVNIALVNELALLSERMDLDIWEVIEAAATKPFGFMPFHPGPGVGGHCIPVDPWYLTWKAREHDFRTRFIELAAETNDRMPIHVVDLVIQALNENGRSVSGSDVLLLGVAFKPDVDDTRNAPAKRIARSLLEKGADVAFHDPHVDRLVVPLGDDPDGETRTLEPVPAGRLDPEDYDCVVAVVPHEAIDFNETTKGADAVVDAANTLPDDAEVDAPVHRLGAQVRTDQSTPGGGKR